LNEFERDIKQIKIGQLLACVGRLHASRTDRYMERNGLYRGQAFLLMILSEKDGLTHSEIAEKLEISPAAATKVIKRLEVLNFLVRCSDPADDRISRVFLKEEGWAVIQQIKNAFQQINRNLLNNFSPDEQNTLTVLLLKLYENLLDQSLYNN